MKIPKHQNIHIIRGVNPVLISAPHTRPIVKNNGKRKTFIKPREVRIVKIVKEVCRQTGSWGIFIKGKGEIHNWDDELQGEYRRYIKKIINSEKISLFFDLHGCKASRPFALDYDFKMPHLHPYDTFLKHTLRKHLIAAYSEKKLSTGFFQTNNGIGNETMTYFVRKNFGLPAIQLEINRKVRVNKQSLNTFIETLSKIINEYNLFIREKDKKKL